MPPAISESTLEVDFMKKLESLKYESRSDIRDRATPETFSIEKFGILNRVRHADGGYLRRFEEIASPDVFTVARTRRTHDSITRDNCMSLNYSLVSTGSMFAQSETFGESHGGKRDNISIYGQECNATTRRDLISGCAH